MKTFRDFGRDSADMQNKADNNNNVNTVEFSDKNKKKRRTSK